MNWFDSWGLTLVVFLPVVGMGIVLLLPREDEQAIKATTLLTTLVTLGVTVGVLARYKYGAGHPGLQFDVNKSWIDVINSRYHIGVDGISLPMLALSSFITVLCVIYSWNHFPEPHNPKAFLALLLLLETGMNGTFVAQDLILFFIFFELVLLPMFFMIGVWGGPNKEYASIKFFLFTMFGSALMLLSFLALYFKVDVSGVTHGAMQHTFDIPTLAAAHGAGLVHGTQLLIFGGLFLGFAIKVPMFPFHTWLPDAHTEAPTVGSVLLAAILLKLGTYGFIRIALPVLPVAARSWAPWIGLLAVIGIIYGALNCLAQTDMKRLIAFSSIAHMGFVMLGIATLTSFGINAAVAGHYGVPVTLVAGDIKAVGQTQALLGDQVVGAVVKEGLSTFTALNLHPIAAQKLIKESAAQAVRNAKSAKPYVLPAAAFVEVEFEHQTRADHASLIPGVERVGERVVGFRPADGREMITLFRAVVKAASVKMAP